MKPFSLAIDKKQKHFFFEKPSNQKPKSKQNVIFRASAILNIFSWKFMGLVFGSVGLIDAKDIDIDVAQPIWSWGCPT